MNDYQFAIATDAGEILNRSTMLINYFDELIQETSQELKKIADSGCVLNLPLGKKMYLIPKYCGNPDCKICPHNLFWRVGKPLEGVSKIHWYRQEYPINKISWSRVQKMSEKDQERYTLVKKHVRKILKRREEIRKLKAEFLKINKRQQEILSKLEGYF